MKRKNLIIGSSSVILILIIIIVCYFIIEGANNEKNNKSYEQIEQEYIEFKDNSIMYKDDATLEDLKDEYKMSGQNDIYEINTEKDGRKVINVKTDINYKVAFCGMIKNKMPNFEELDSIFVNNHPSLVGIWVNTLDREKILNYLNNSKFLNCNYNIDNEGFIKVQEADNKTDYDKQIINLINNNKQYILSVSSICYMVDPVTGNIVDNPYNELDKYQSYEYFKDNNKMIIFITENKNKKLENDDIFVNLMNLQKSIDIK